MKKPKPKTNKERLDEMEQKLADLGILLDYLGTHTIKLSGIIAANIATMKAGMN